MIKEIIKDINILQQKSENFILGEDDYLINDLIDTANAQDNCVGLSSIQIGVPKKVIVVRNGDNFIPMINPVIIKRSQQTYIANEKCFSLDGERKVKRHKRIKVCYTTSDGKNKCVDVDGLFAQIVQHECDHLQGKLI